MTRISDLAKRSGTPSASERAEQRKAKAEAEAKALSELPDTPSVPATPDLEVLSDGPPPLEKTPKSKSKSKIADKDLADV
jgi:hypothetical protein